MIGDLQPYSEMKDFGVPWLGHVPAHWAVRPNRALFQEVRVQDRPDEPMLSVTISRGVIRQADLLSDTSKKDSSNLDRSKYKLVEPGDIAYNKMRAWQGAVGASKFRGIVSPAYIVQRPRAGVLPAYMHHLLRTPAFATEAERWSYGISSDQWSLRPEHFRMIYSCLPPVDEQGAIVRFLDWVDRRIGRYIKAKQKLIKLLEEQKQAIIHQAVTRGLNPNAPLKPSGIPWLGDIPTHWEVRALKFCAGVQTGLTLGKNYGDQPTEQYPYLRVANVQHGRVDLHHVKHITVPPREAAGSTLRAGDVLMTEGGDIDKLGRGCVWQDQISGCLHQNHIFAVRCNVAVLLPEFLAALLVSGHGRAYFQLTAKQTTNLAATNSTTLKAFPVLVPPTAEQDGILAHLAAATSAIDAALDRCRAELQLMSEYRTRLIADVVTGKLDVREAAANLPPEDVAPPEDVGADEDELTDDEADQDAIPEEAEVAE